MLPLFSPSLTRDLLCSLSSTSDGTEAADATRPTGRSAGWSGITSGSPLGAGGVDRWCRDSSSRFLGTLEPPPSSLPQPAGISEAQLLARRCILQLAHHGGMPAHSPLNGVHRPLQASELTVRRHPRIHTSHLHQLDQKRGNARPEGLSIMSRSRKNSGSPVLSRLSDGSVSPDKPSESRVPGCSI